MTPIVEYPPQQHGLGIRPPGGTAGALLAQSALHGIEQVAIKDGLVLPGIDLPPVNDLADIAAVVQEIGEGASRERDAAKLLLALTLNAAAPAVSRWIEPAGTAKTYSRPASRKW